MTPESDKKIKELTKQIEMIEKFIKPLEEIGITGSVVSNEFLSLKIDTIDDIKKITKLFPPSDRLFNLTFAGRDPIKTMSQFSIHVGNFKHSEADKATVKYDNENINIWITLPLENNFTIHKTEVTNTIGYGKNQKTIIDGYNTSVTLGRVQAYRGSVLDYGSRVTYASDKKEADIFHKKFMY